MKRKKSFVSWFAIVGLILISVFAEAQTQGQKEIDVNLANEMLDDVEVSAGPGCSIQSYSSTVPGKVTIKSGQKSLVVRAKPGADGYLVLNFKVISGTYTPEGGDPQSRVTAQGTKRYPVKYKKTGRTTMKATISETFVKALVTKDLKADFVPEILWDNKTGLDIQINSRELKETGITISKNSQSFVTRRNKVNFISAEVVCLADDNMTEFRRMIKIPITVNNDNAYITLTQSMLFEDMDGGKVKIAICNKTKSTYAFRWCLLGDQGTAAVGDQSLLSQSGANKTLTTDKVVIAPGATKIVSVPAYGAFLVSGQDGNYECFRPTTKGEKLYFFKGRLLSKKEYQETRKLYGE